MKTPRETPSERRYGIQYQHGEHGTVYYVLDLSQPESEQPCIIHSWSTATEPNARFLAEDFCIRHNATPIETERCSECGDTHFMRELHACYGGDLLCSQCLSGVAD